MKIWCWKFVTSERTRIQQINPLKTSPLGKIYTSCQSYLNFTSFINLSTLPPPFLCSPPLFLSPDRSRTPLRQHNSLFSLTTTVAIECCQPDWCIPRAALPLLLTRFPKGRKARLWPSAWWAPTAVCSGITATEKGGIPALAAFVTARPLFAFDKTAVQSTPGPSVGREGRTQRWLPFIGRGVAGLRAKIPSSTQYFTFDTGGISPN